MYKLNLPRTFRKISLMSLLSCYGVQSSTKDLNILKINIEEFIILKKLTPRPTTI